MERAGAASIEDRLGEELDRRSARLSIAVFATGAGALGRLRATRPQLRSVVVLTDATAHRLWAHPGIDRYLALSPLAAASLRTYLPAADIAVIPPPVRPSCYAPPGRDEARRRFGLDPDVPVALLTAGAWGRASLDDLARVLLEAGLGVVALAGSNAALHARLGALPARRRPQGTQRLLVCGWTDEVPELMAASDVVVSTPGQACHEARAVGRPVVLLDVVPGHGRENLLAELALGGALASSPQPQQMLAAVRAVLDGVAGPLPAWPVSDEAAWHAAFLAAISDLGAPPARSGEHLVPEVAQAEQQEQGEEAA
jgi:UDP-N-acetylglucosamine:LPS N-acetylglucosamine transferase